MFNVKDPGKYTRSMRPLVPRSREEQLALYARGPDDLDAALAGPSREDLDQARAGQWTIRQITCRLTQSTPKRGMGWSPRAMQMFLISQ